MFKLISYDIEHINAVLILNFFRYLDNLITYERGDASVIISDVYYQIEMMSDEELFIFLKKIGLSISDTMEFNFFGAHQIDYDALVYIKIKGEATINMSELIADLEKGRLDKLNSLNMDLPEILQSYRFVDYLSTKTKDLKVLEELLRYRLACRKVPQWYPMPDTYNIEKPSPKKPVTVKPILPQYHSVSTQYVLHTKTRHQRGKKQASPYMARKQNTTETESSLGSFENLQGQRRSRRLAEKGK